MRVFLLDGAAVEDWQDLHAQLARGLHFPDWYGGTLDALYDCLTDLAEETELRIINQASLETALGEDVRRFFRVLKDAVEENSRLVVTWN